MTNAQGLSASPSQRPLGPDARQFLAPPTSAYWAGTERLADGELSLAPPRPWLDSSLLPAKDDHLSTTGYARYGYSQLFSQKPGWNLLEIASLHDLKGGAVLGVAFRADMRATTAVEARGTFAIPLRWGVFLLPSVALGTGSDTSPVVTSTLEGRMIDDMSLRSYSVGIEASGWSYDRARVLGKLGTLHRLSRTFAMEGHIGVGAWAGPLMGGDVALQVVAAAMQELNGRLGLYERATFARGAAYQVGAALPDESAYSVDVAAGLRWKGSEKYGFTLAADGGGQLSYKRIGLEVTAYGTLF
jgi:hypothetical protein